MELSERFIRKLEEEYPHVYEWDDPAGTVYETHEHKGKSTVWVTDGSIVFDFSGEKKEVTAGKRLDIPPQTPHSAIVGTDGWKVVVGEEIAGDT